MKIIAICGGTGLTGRAIAEKLHSNGYQIRIITRSKKNNSKYDQFLWDPAKEFLENGALEGVHGIIQLSGESLANHRWNTKTKALMYQSRVDSTRFLVQQINAAKQRPKIFISATGIGIYGNRPGESLDETDEPGNPSFIVDLCKDWEGAVSGLDPEVRQIIVRTSLVLSREDGILQRFLLPSRFGLAPVFGNGQQIYSWIHIQDLAALYNWFIENETCRGIYIAASPHPVSELNFAFELAKLRGPFVIPIPAPKSVMRIILGEFAQNLFDSVLVHPKKSLKEGFQFQFPELTGAIKNLNQQ